MTFTGAQIAQFQADGYVAVPEFWTGEEASGGIKEYGVQVGGTWEARIAG